MRYMLVAAAAAAVVSAGSALAADLGGWKDTMAYEPIAAPVLGWGGAYIGISGGMTWLSNKTYDSEGDGCVSNGRCPDGLGIGGLVGGTFGYNWQIRNLVLGVEGDISWADLSATVRERNDKQTQSQFDAIATLRLRSGYAVGTNLFYLTGGAAFLGTQHKVLANDPVFNTSNDGWRTGFAVGAGYEAMLSNNLSVKAEYLYIGVPTDTMVNAGDNTQRYGFTDNVQVARIGLNYKLGNGSASAPYLSGGMKDTMAYEEAAGWSGPYIGISGGSALLSKKTFDSEGGGCVASETCPDGQGIGGLVGGTFGYNWQIRNLVLGVEGDISWAGLDATVRELSDKQTQSYIDAIATMRLRGGYAVGANLFYVTGGAAFLGTQHKVQADQHHAAMSTSDDGWRTGIAVGAGYEAMLSNNLSFKAEYLYIGVPTDTMANPVVAGGYYGFTDDVQVARIGLNYKFNGGGAGYMPLK